MRWNDLSAAVGVSVPNPSILKKGKAKAVRFSTLEAICRVLDCQLGDILEFRLDDSANTKSVTESISSNDAHPLKLADTSEGTLDKC